MFYCLYAKHLIEMKKTEITEIQKTSFAKEIADINPY